MAKTQDPIVTSDRDVVRESHPAYAQISLARISGKQILYGSSFVHQNAIELRISASEMQREVSRDWHMPRDPLVTVRLSEAQFATLVSSIGVFGGVPCTLVDKDGVQIPGIPARDEKRRFESDLAARLGEALDRLDRAREKIESAGLSKRNQEELLDEIGAARRQLEENVPFVERSFAEPMEKIVAAAKIEIHAHLQTAGGRAPDAIGSSRPDPVLSLSDDREALVRE